MTAKFPGTAIGARPLATSFGVSLAITCTKSSLVIKESLAHCLSFQDLY